MEEFPMTLHYVCTDFDLDGPSPQERARIGLLLSCLYARGLECEQAIEESNSQLEIDKWNREANFVASEIRELTKLLPESHDEIMRQLAEEYDE
jgi:hypothetical protein